MLALLCSGQGRLSPGMFDLVAERPEAAPIFAAAGTLLDCDPRDLIHAEDRQRLLANRTSQILSVTEALAVHACIADLLPEPLAVTGYSVGEMAAWSIAGVWSAETALRLTDIRAQAMDEAGGADGLLGYVRGLGRNALEALAARHGCAIAIINPGNLFVVGGARSDVIALCRDAEAAGASHAALLAVCVASHTARLAGAVAPFREALQHATAAGPKHGRLLLAGAGGARVFSAAGAIAGLAAEVASPLDWAATLQALVELGVDRVLDLGPGDALADMIRHAFGSVAGYAASGFRSVDGLRDWIRRV
jgi:[acyl-carrier-protein] S-malonyltransferase